MTFKIMKKYSLYFLLFVFSSNITAQTPVNEFPKAPFQVDWNSASSCIDFKEKYPTTKNPRNDPLEELTVNAPHLHFTGADFIQVVCANNQLFLILVRIPKLRNDGVDFAAVYEELSRVYELDVAQVRQIEGNIAVTFTAGDVKVKLADDETKQFRTIHFSR